MSLPGPTSQETKFHAGKYIFTRLNLQVQTKNLYKILEHFSPRPTSPGEFNKWECFTVTFKTIAKNHARFTQYSQKYIF